MWIIGIDTSTQVGGAAIMADGEVVAEYLLNVTTTHSRRLLHTIDLVIKDAGISLSELDAFAVGVGPGSFTGLRIGIATIKGLAFALSKPVVPVSSLSAIAMNAMGSPLDIRPVVQARKGELFTGLFKMTPSGLISLQKEEVLSPDQIICKIQQPTFLLGNGLHIYGDFFKTHREKQVVIGHPAQNQIRPSMVAWLGQKGFLSGQAVGAKDILPHYIRPSDAERNWEARKSLL